MNDPIRIELTGKNAEQWEKVFGTLADIISKGLSHLVPDDSVARDTTETFVCSISDITKRWAAAHVERPSLENEKIVAEIAVLFEDAKLRQAQRTKIELENEGQRLELLEKRVMTAFRLLGFLQNNMSRDEAGNVILVLTNQSLAGLHGRLMELTSENEERV